MADDPTPTTLRRQLGARLRQLRQDRGETAEDVAKALRVSVSKVSRMETGARAVSEQDIIALVEYFALADNLAQELVDLARAGKRRRAVVPYPVAELEHINMVKSGFVELEQDAARVREFNSGIIPGLLQTSAYMRCMMESSLTADEGFIARAMELRRGRQQRLNVVGRYEAVIDEAVIVRVVGDAQVMIDQLASIERRLDSGQVDLRVIPFSAGVHPGLNSMFVALTMEGEDVPDTVFMEGLAGHLKIDRPDEIRRFDEVWSQLLERAATPAETRTLLAGHREEFQARADERSLQRDEG